MQTNNAGDIGRTAALLAATFGIIYSAFGLLSVFKIIRHPCKLLCQFLPSLLLAFAFIETVICLHHSLAEEFKVYTAFASAFAVLYGACVAILYFTQIAVVIPALLKHKIHESHILAFTDKSFIIAVNCIGYGLMSIATLFAAIPFDKRSTLFRKV
jgi:hypothetical protein